MGKINWHRQHRWSGIVSAFVLLMFSLSGVVLNHRDWFDSVEVSRKVLPPWYEFKDWNGGLLRGTIAYGDSVLIFGGNGVWLADKTGSGIKDFNNGFPSGTDNRQVRSVVAAKEGFYAATPTAVYRLDKGIWKRMPLNNDDRLSDLTAKGDTLIAVGRSHLYVYAGGSFNKITLKSSPDNDGKVTLFRTVWMLHNGELFGIPGRIIVDMVALVLIVLSLTGLTLWLLPKDRKHKRPHAIKADFFLHNKVGKATILLTLLIVITGWCLRPPVMIPLALNKTRPIPATTLDNDNPWHDKLRMLRYDNKAKDWLLSTSDGFYTLTSLNSTPRELKDTPPVSVMGANVLECDSDDSWLCGSFSGMYRWNRNHNHVTDYFTGQAAKTEPGPPFGKFAVSGYSKDFNAVVEYYAGTRSIPQPEGLKNLPMSLWNVALEAHSGRLFIGSIATYIFIFITGLIAAWCLWSGWKARKH